MLAIRTAVSRVMAIHSYRLDIYMDDDMALLSPVPDWGQPDGDLYMLVASRKADLEPGLQVQASYASACRPSATPKAGCKHSGV